MQVRVERSSSALSIVWFNNRRQGFGFGISSEAIALSSGVVGFFSRCPEQ
jgi:hypothetical protein